MKLAGFNKTANAKIFRWIFLLAAPLLLFGSAGCGSG